MNLAAITDTGDERLVPIDPDRRQLALFDTWTDGFLETVAPQHRQLIGTFLRWGLRRRLRHAATTGTLRPWSTRGARQQAGLAVEFVEWLDERDVTLDGCTQALLDAWFAEGPSTRQQSVAFLTWAIQHRHCPSRLRVPNFKRPAPSPMPGDQRRALINRLVSDDGIRLQDRVAGLLVTLYAQPASRIVRLRLDDVHRHDGRVALDIAGEPIQLVTPLDQMLADLADSRPETGGWLFPGQVRGQPLNPKSLGYRLQRIGVNRAARVAALHDLIREVPGPVLAPLIGYNPNFLADRAATLAVPWANYPAIRQRS
jgi:hypothetical protein